MNPTQKKFRKEMEDGLMNLKKRDEEVYYKYIAQNNLDNPEQRLKYETKEKFKNFFKNIFLFIAAITIVGGIIPFAYNEISSFRSKTTNIEINSSNTIVDSIIAPKQNKQKEIVECLNALRPFLDNISNDIEKRNNDVEQINNKKLSKNDYIKSLQVHDELTKKNITDISNINIPSELGTYVNLINEGYQLLCEGYELESIFLKTNQQKYRQLSTDNYKLSNEKLNNSNTELIKVLDSYNIKLK